MESSGSWPAMTSKSSAASATVVGERADLVERAGEGDQPVARDAAVGGLHPDHAAQRGGLADRATGVGAERRAGRSRPPPRRPTRRCCPRAPCRCRGGCGSGRRPSSRSRCPWRTRPCWSCRARPRRRRAALRPRWRRRAGASPRGSSRRRWSATPRVHRLSFSATGTPASGPGSRPAATAASTASACGPGLVGEDGEEGVELAVAGVDGGERLLDHLAGRPRARSGPRPPGPSADVVTAPRPGCGAPGSGGPPPRAPGRAPRPGRGWAAARRAAARCSSAIGWDDGSRCGQVERGHVGGVVEHGAQLRGEQLELVVASARGGPAGPRGRRRRG